MSFSERTQSLIGQKNIEALSHKKVIVFGCGGVGGYVIEMLARTGIGELSIVDFDSVSESNINRQIIADYSTIGKKKVDCFAKRIDLINPNCKVNTFAKKVTPENIGEFELLKYDFVVDCIDDVKSKVALIKFCKTNNIEIVSSMGAGNRYDTPNFVVADISKTQNDRLARAVRQRLKKENILHTKVVYTKSLPKVQKVVGSIAYYPACCGIVMASYIINCLIESID